MKPILYEGMLFGMPILIKAYSTMNLLALLVVVGYGAWSLRKQQVSWIKITLMAVTLAASFLVGSRVYYTLLHLGRFLESPYEVFKLQLVNFGLYGGLIASLATLSLWSWREKLNLWGVMDRGIPWMALALSLSKGGCFLNGCCYGVPSSVPWAVYFPRAEGGFLGWLSPGILNAVFKKGDLVLRHPTQLYEVLVFIASYALIVLIFRVLRRWNHPAAQVQGLQAIGYVALITLGRLIVYGWRDYPNSSILTEVVRGPVTYGMVLTLAAALVFWRIRDSKRRN